MLDISAKPCYTISCIRGHRTSASISAFQAEEVGSIPIARSMQKRRWFVQDQRLSLYPHTAQGLQPKIQSFFGQHVPLLKNLSLVHQMPIQIRRYVVYY